MQSDFFIKRQTNYEEIQNKKLKEFYVVIQVVSTEIMLGEKIILEPTKLYMIYGIDILGYRTIIGLYTENKEDNRFWLKEIEKNKEKRAKKVYFSINRRKQ